MKDYKDIQEYNAYNTGVEAFTLISKIYWRYKKGFGIRGDGYDLSANEIALIAIIHWYDGIDTAHLIRRELGITKGMVSRYVDGLIKKGLLYSEVDENDKRIIRLRLSESAVNICTEVVSMGEDFLKLAFKDITPENILVMVDTLSRIYANLEAFSEI